ncbi:GntR family transcriptional regulator [Lentzea sp. HUAS12]|uniref:UTRA domain-containing protein n=1 Tax=Lentzea sp. HUAS12 TaxID=2951806 RepID=UPI00209EFE0B|nr:GntR family transcriptional regulator [Lentzea sp. HUAS12]USX56320.1 GntR family transcriptional regulator [Lentzea sp. HUAS12]
MLTRKRGVGTTVVNNRACRATQLTRLYEDLERAGTGPSTEVLGFEVVAATEDIAAALTIEAGADVIAVRRPRFVDDEPLAILRNHVRAALGVTAVCLAEEVSTSCSGNPGTPCGRSNRPSVRKATAAEATLLNEGRGDIADVGPYRARRPGPPA